MTTNTAVKMTAATREVILAALNIIHWKNTKTRILGRLLLFPSGKS